MLHTSLGSGFNGVADVYVYFTKSIYIIINVINIIRARAGKLARSLLFFFCWFFFFIFRCMKMNILGLAKKI